MRSKGSSFRWSAFSMSPRMVLSVASSFLLLRVGVEQVLGDAQVLRHPVDGNSS